MGVDITQYLLVGVKVDYETYAEKFEDQDRKLDKYISQISDGMSGEYFYIGHIIEEEDEEGDFISGLYEGFETLKKKYKKVYTKVEKEIKQYLNEGEDCNVQLFYIKHYH